MDNQRRFQESQNKQVKLFFANVEKFSAFLSRSPKRTPVLDTIVLQRRLPRGSSTRWNSSSRVVNTAYEQKSAILECLQVNADVEVNKGAIRQTTGLINYLNDVVSVSS